MNRTEELEYALHAVQAEIASYQPTLIVVTKTYPESDVQILYNAGCRDFGENRSAEGLAKSSAIDATWHFQGQIQSKKIREIASWASVIHSLDSLAHAEKLDRSIEGSAKNLFIQLSLDGDPTRGGVIESQLWPLAEKVLELPHINLQGVMCVPPVEMQPEVAFKKIREIHERFIGQFPTAPYLSAGMSGDYMMALDHGATHIRVGSKILGSRPPVA